MAAPVYDNSINAWSASNVASLTSASFAIGGTNRFIVGFISSGAGSPADPSGMKWGGSGGTAFTKQGTTLTFGTYFKHSCFTLLNPTAQTSTLYGNWPSNQDETTMACVSVTGVDQTTPMGTIATNTGSSEAVSVNVTTVADDFVVDGLWIGTTGGTLSRTLTVGANQTARQVVDGANPSVYETFGCSTEVATGTTTTMSWTISGTGGVDGWGIFAVPLKPAAGGSPIVQAIGQATETDSANSIAYVFAVLADQAEETDTALPIIAPIIRAVGLATETEAAQSVTRLNPDIITGLDFPDNATIDNGDTVSFKWTNPHSNGLPIYGTPVTGGLTYIWRYYPKQQAGYYTTFFWGNNDGGGTLATFLWTEGGGADSYYGAHPYPNPAPNGTDHEWEVSVEQADYVNGTVEYDRWHIQALRVWEDASGNKHHELYWDLPLTDSGHLVSRTSPNTWGNTNPPSPALTWGDAPWQPGNELGYGIHRGIQIYSNLLSLSEILEEIAEPLSSAKAGDIWYLNLNPTLDDISDKSGNGNDPAWVGALRPTLYSAIAKTLGIATETETAHGLIQPHIGLVGLNAEADTVFSLTVKKTHAIGQATEVEAGQPLSALKQLGVGLTTESESVQPITATKTKGVGLSEESESGIAFASLKAKAVGLSTETDLAQALTLQDATLVGQVAETNAAQAITSRKSLALGLTQETDGALSVGPVKAKALGLTAETEQVFGLSAAKTQGIGLTTESDLAQGLAVQGSTLLGQTEEVDEALAISAQKVRSVGLSSETEAAQALTGQKVRTIGLVAEADQALGIAAFHDLVQVVETDSGLPIRVIKTRIVGLTDGGASSLTILAWKRRAIGLTAEVEIAQSLAIEEPPPEPVVAAPRSRTNQFAHGHDMPSRSSRGISPRRGRS